MTDTLGASTEAGIGQAVQDAFTRAFTNFKGTFSFERKISRGKFSDQDAQTASIHVQFDYAPDATGEEFLDAAREAAFKAKALVFEQLGLDVERVDGVLMEVNTDSFLNGFTGAVIEEREDVRPDPRDDSRSQEAVSATAPHSKTELEGLSGEMLKAARKENTRWAQARFETHPNEFWDNRTSKAKDSYPDYRHKTEDAAFWVKS